MRCDGRIAVSLKRILSLRINTAVSGEAVLRHATSPPLHLVSSSENGEEAKPDSIIQE